MHSPHGIYGAEVLNISTTRLYVGDRETQKGSELHAGGRGGRGTGTGEKHPNLKGRSTRGGKGKEQVASCCRAGEGEEGKKRG